MTVCAFLWDPFNSVGRGESWLPFGVCLKTINVTTTSLCALLLARLMNHKSSSRATPVPPFCTPPKISGTKACCANKVIASWRCAGLKQNTRHSSLSSIHTDLPRSQPVSGKTKAFWFELRLLSRYCTGCQREHNAYV